MGKNKMNEAQLKKAARVYGRQGGKKTLAKYGREHFSKISKKRWEDQKKRQKENNL